MIQHYPQSLAPAQKGAVFEAVPGRQLAARRGKSDVVHALREGSRKIVLEGNSGTRPDFLQVAWLVSKNVVFLLHPLTTGSTLQYGSMTPSCINMWELHYYPCV